MRKILFLAVSVILAACSNDPIEQHETIQPEQASLSAPGDPYNVSVTGANYSGVFIVANRRTECEIVLTQNPGVNLGGKATISFGQNGPTTDGYLFTYGAGIPGLEYSNGSYYFPMPYSTQKIIEGSVTTLKFRFSNTIVGAAGGHITVTTGSGLTQRIEIYILF